MAPLAASRAEGEGLPDLCSLMTVRPLRPLGVPPPPTKRGGGDRKRKKEWPFDSGQTAVSFFAVGWEQRRGRPPWREERIK